jgi:hypothetical protein
MNTSDTEWHIAAVGVGDTEKSQAVRSVDYRFALEVNIHRCSLDGALSEGAGSPDRILVLSSHGGPRSPPVDGISWQELWQTVSHPSLVGGC